MSRQFQVLDYISDKDRSPLEFYYPDTNIKHPDLTLSLDEFVMQIVNLTHSYRSKNINNWTETNLGKWRSSLDIWRHVIYYKPEVTIFEVMEALYNRKKYYVSHYCPDIQRRVFKLEKNYKDGYLQEIDRDEYGLYFYEWENISKE